MTSPHDRGADDQHDPSARKDTLRVDLGGRRALVTGGTRGIGAATAALLRSAGAQVVVSARSDPGGNPSPVLVADLSTAAGVERLADQTLAALGGVDILVSNVGGQVRRPGALDFTEQDWQQELSINLLAAVRLDRALAPHMVAQRAGVIVHVSSGAARVARPSSLPYSAAKAALNAYSKGLASDLGRHGVRVNTVSPGLIETSRMAEVAAERGVEPSAMLAQVAASLEIPLGRAGTAEEVAQLILFLASPAASYLTGSHYVVDGGAFPVT